MDENNQMVETSSKYVVCKTRTAYNISAGRAQGNTPSGMTQCNWDNNIQTDLK
jgi:hypothetical protein